MQPVRSSIRLCPLHIFHTHRTINIAADTADTLNSLFSLLPSRKSCQSFRGGSTRLLNSIIRQAVRMLNSVQGFPWTATTPKTHKDSTSAAFAHKIVKYSPLHLCLSAICSAPYRTIGLLPIIYCTTVTLYWTLLIWFNYFLGLGLFLG